MRKRERNKDIRDLPNDIPIYQAAEESGWGWRGLSSLRVFNTF